MQEKRKYVRVRCNLITSFKETGGGDPKFFSSEASIEDVSVGGARIRIGKFIPLTSRVIVRFNFPGRRELLVPMAPIWFYELPSGHRYEVGGRFVDMSDGARMEIESYVRESLGKK